MKKVAVSLVVLLVLSVFVTTQSFAAQEGAGKAATQSKMESKDKQAQSGGKDTKFRWSRDVNDLMGNKVYDSQGQEVGTVADLVLDKNGNVSHMILSRGGVLGIGDEEIPVPWKAVKPASDNVNELVLNYDMKKLGEGPKYTRGEWPRENDAEWNRDVDVYYTDIDVQKAGREGQPTTGKAQMSGQQAGGGQKVARASKIKGDTVQSQAGEELGTIENIVLNQQTGRIEYAVVSRGGTMGVGEQLVPVPWNALKPGTKEDTFVMNMNKDKFAKAPGFEEGNWPDLSGSEWQQKIHGYYGTQPSGHGMKSDEGTKKSQ